MKYLAAMLECLFFGLAIIMVVAAIIGLLTDEVSNFAHLDQVVSEQVVESHSVSSAVKTEEDGTVTYHVIEQVDGVEVANTYTANMKNLEVRDDDGLGQRIDKVSTERRGLFWIKKPKSIVCT